MTKAELINGCIDLSYNVSKTEMLAAIHCVRKAHGEKNLSYMKPEMPVAMWRDLYARLNNIVNQTNGTTVLFIGSDVESYRIK